MGFTPGKYKPGDIVYIKPIQEIQRIIKSGIVWPGRNSKMDRMAWTYHKILYITGWGYYKINDDDWYSRNFMEEWLGESFTPLFI